MKVIFFLLILLCLVSCDRGSDIIREPSISMRGINIGSFSATYPGPDGGPITVKDSIQLLLTDYKFSYYRFGGDNVDTLVDGQGVYAIESDLTFFNEIEPTTYPYLTIDSTFNIRWVRTDNHPDTLILSQGSNPEDPNGFFESTYLIKLVRMEEVDE